jgi:hypothetical protein
MEIDKVQTWMALNETLRVRGVSQLERIFSIRFPHFSNENYIVVSAIESENLGQ